MVTRIFGKDTSIRGIIIAEMKQKMLIGTKVKPLDQDQLNKMAAGSMHGTKKLGYGWPVRKVREHCRKTEVTLPSYVAREIRVVAGNYVVWCQTNIVGLLTIAECAAVYELDVDGLPILGRQLAISKVRKNAGSHEISIPKKAKADLGETTGESIIFGVTHYPGVVTVNVIKKPDDDGGQTDGASRTD